MRIPVQRLDLQRRFLAIILLLSSPIALADPAQMSSPSLSSPAERICPAADAQKAHSLADALVQQGDYEHANDCYRAAGDYNRAHWASLKALGAQTASTSRALADNRDEAKAQVRHLQQAFHR